MGMACPIARILKSHESELNCWLQAKLVPVYCWYTFYIGRGRVVGVPGLPIGTSLSKDSRDARVWLRKNYCGSIFSIAVAIVAVAMVAWVASHMVPTVVGESQMRTRPKLKLYEISDSKTQRNFTSTKTTINIFQIYHK